ncbi:unnamed protein product [Paramecium primaurelia]|uniref:WD domain, G-beta repeat protein n=1 Tax=Paramecium primaurelia TaxID=5886 RepID=A0A8S1KDX1_PARPR|nr:unnamed protein product [Paramecium primaurelia]
MNKLEGFLNQDCQTAIEECFKEVQTKIESSFNNIYIDLDSLINEIFDVLNDKYQKCIQRSPPLINLPQIKLEDYNIFQQIFQDIISIIKSKINNQALLKEKEKELLINMSLKCEQQMIEILQQLEQKSNDKDILLEQQTLQIQQLNTQLNIQQSSTVKSTHSQSKPFNYQIIKEFSISKSDQCYALAIDNDCSTLVAGCYSTIKVFEFNSGVIKLIQNLNEHKSFVYTLNFMKKSKHFLSGSLDSSIIIWKYIQNNLWCSQQILYGHSNQINCLVINKYEDLIISGSNDNTIKFWINKNEWLCQQTIADHSSSVYGLVLNQQQNRVVSCGHDKVILIIEQSGQNTEWKVVQKMKVDQFGYRVCFIDNNMFTFSQGEKEYISVFEMNTINKLFTKTRDINIKSGSDNGNCLFPQQYINGKCILLSKNGQYINLIRKKQNWELLTEQSIHFGTNSLFGVMSDDGEYLITWDEKSKQIQIRRYKEQ